MRVSVLSNLPIWKNWTESVHSGHSKRLDLQGLRAWAVVAVVVFHFFPSLLPLGYLGVDVFFVLSGFLITMVLSKSDPAQFITYFNFYFKRFRRIFPLLLLVVLILIVFVEVHYEGQLLLYNCRSALLALFFVSNLKGQDKGEDYFMALEKATNLFTHTWSLAVEIQFYFLAPIILLSGRALFVSRPSLLLPYLSLLSTGSLMFFSSALPMVAFNSTLARLWQFLAGAIAYQQSQQSGYRRLGEEAAVYGKEQGTKHNVACLLLFAIAIPSVVLNVSPELVTRIAVTAVVFVVISWQCTNVLLTHPFLVYLGDISYALYLVHWPVVCILGEYNIDDVQYRVLAMLASVVVSGLVHQWYEKWHLTLEEKGTTVLVSSFYVLSFAALLFSGQPLLGGEGSMTTFDMGRNVSLDEAMMINADFESKWAQNLQLPNCSTTSPDSNPWTMCIEPKGTGTRKFFVFGNSFTANHARMVLKHFGHHYSEIHVRAYPSCEALLTTTKYGWCGSTHADFINHIEEFKPDILFIQQRFLDSSIPINGTMDADPQFIEIMKDLAVYENSTASKIFILQSLPQIAEPHKLIKARIAAKKALDGEMKEVIESDSIPMRQRLLEVARRCKKCVLYDLYNRHLDENGKFNIINPHTFIQYFESSRHHTPYGLQLVEPVYEKMAADFESLLAASSPNNVVEWKD